MLLRHALLFAGIAVATPSPPPTNNHNFTADDFQAVASDIIKRVYQTYISENESYYLTGLVDNDDPYAVSPIFWGAVIDHSWLSTTRIRYNDAIKDALDHRFGPSGTFAWDNPHSVDMIRSDLSNADVAAWAQLALDASTTNWNTHRIEGSWLNEAEGIFNYLSLQWNDPETPRNGGILSKYVGDYYTMINPNAVNKAFFFAETNANFFHLAARLASITDYNKYKDWATKTYDWMESIGMLTSNFTVKYAILANPKSKLMGFDGVASSDSALMAAGAAYMYNITNGDAKWKKRVEGLVSQIEKTFFTKDGILVEQCETMTDVRSRCSSEVIWTKAQTPPLLVSVMRRAGFTTDKLVPLLMPNAAAVAKSCVDDTNSPCKPTAAHGQYDPRKGPDEMGDYVASLNAMNAALSIKWLTVTDTVEQGNKSVGKGETKSGSNPDKSAASSLSGAASVWGVALIVADIMSM